MKLTTHPLRIADCFVSISGCAPRSRKKKERDKTSEGRGITFNLRIGRSVGRLVSVACALFPRSLRRHNSGETIYGI